MERRNAITAAATAALTLIAGAGGMALSSGVLGAAADDGVGRVSPVPSSTGQRTPSESLDPSTTTTTLPPSTVAPTTPPVTVTDRPSDATSATSTVRTDDRSGSDDPEEGEHEYEGADDDD